jgi:hypothetical protein
MTEVQLQYCQRVDGIAAADDWWRLMIDEEQRREAMVEKAAVRQLNRLATATGAA